MLAALVVASSWASHASADTIDDFTPDVELRPTADQPKVSARGTLSLQTGGFHGHAYTASKDGLVRVRLDVTNTPARPYLRILTSGARGGEAWSTNGRYACDDANVCSHGSNPSGIGSATLVLRATKGERFTIVATNADNAVGFAVVTDAAYTLTVEEAR
jgi:hypothetical protein